MELPSHLNRIHAQTDLVCELPMEIWVQRYVESGQCVADWDELHIYAMRQLLHESVVGGTAHGFASRPVSREEGPWE